jgi:hypothetical protein
MTKRKSEPSATRESNAERTNKAAREQIDSDTARMRAKTERLRALRVAKEADEAAKRLPKGK